MKGPIQAWHFARDDRRLSAALEYHDQSIVVVPGLTLEHNKRKLKPCKAGLHASISPLDALNYAPGSFVSRVELRGKILEHGEGRTDKLCASWRRHLWCADATEVLLAFLRWRALEVIDLWRAPEVVRRYLETGDEAIRDAARDAARAAARDAYDTAWNVAGDAAWATVQAAQAARAAAQTAARAVIRAAAWAAWAAAHGAAREAARDIAWDAEEKKQSKKLEEMLFTLKGEQHA